MDRRLIAEIADPGSSTLLQLVGGTSKNLGARMVAQRVEGEDQLAIVRDLDCTAVQGFLVSKPLFPDALLAWAQGQTHSQAAARVPDPQHDAALAASTT